MTDLLRQPNASIDQIETDRASIRRVLDLDAHSAFLAPDDHTGAAATSTRERSLGSLKGLEVGIREIGSGVVDVVARDEVFVVLSGYGSVRVDGGPTLLARPGSVIRLLEGDRVQWIVTQRIRQVYVG